MASLTMGIADFPIELFRSVKHKHQNSFKTESGKETAATTSSSGSDTPPLASRSTSQLDLALADERLAPLSPEAPTSAISEASSQQATASTASAKTSYESTDRSSTDRGTDTPLTSTASLGSVGEHRGSSLRNALRGDPVKIAI